MSSAAAPDPGVPPPLSCRRRLKCILLWAARRLIASDGYAGPLEVEVKLPAEADSAIFKATPDADGLTAPSGVTVTRGEPGGAPGPTREELLAHFLSDDPKTVLRELAAIEPAQATAVQDAVRPRGVSKGAFWTIWKQLQVRGLVVETREGFRLGPPWLRSVIGLCLVLKVARRGVLMLAAGGDFPA